LASRPAPQVRLRILRGAVQSIGGLRLGSLRVGVATSAQYRVVFASPLSACAALWRLASLPLASQAQKHPLPPTRRAVSRQCPCSCSRVYHGTALFVNRMTPTCGVVWCAVVAATPLVALVALQSARNSNPRQVEPDISMFSRVLIAIPDKTKLRFDVACASS